MNNKYCINCGNQLSIEARFCAKCGVSFSDGLSPNSDGHMQNENDLIQKKSHDNNPFSKSDKSTNAKPKNNIGKLLVFTLFTLAILAVIIWFSFIHHSNICPESCKMNLLQNLKNL